MNIKRRKLFKGMVATSLLSPFNVVGGLLSVVLIATFPARADEFRWQGNPSDWQSWSDVSLWAADGVAAGRVPDGATDFLWPYSSSGTVIGRFDLEGQSRTIGGYSATELGASWKVYELHLTNGTLNVTNAKSPAYSDGSRAISYTLWSGTTLNYGGPTDGASPVAIGGSDLYEDWFVKPGATMVCPDFLRFRTARIVVSRNASLTLGNGGFRLHFSSKPNMPTTLTNQGQLLLPNGLVWSGDPYSDGNLYKLFTLTQSAGEIRMGGDFAKVSEEEDAHAALMKFVFAGGTLVAEEGRKVAFRNATTKHGKETFAEVSAGAAVTVDTRAGSELDMGLFAYGEGSSVRKVGPGLLRVCDLPSSLIVSEGSVGFCATNTPLGNVTFADGMRVVLDAPGTSLKDVSNAEGLTYVLGESFPTSGVILSGLDPAVAERIAAKITLPERLASSIVAVESGTISLKLPLTVVACSFSVPTGTEASGCGYTAVGLESGDRADEVLSGTPLYDFGGYTASSAAGTYQVTLSGLTSEKYQVVCEPGTVWAFDAPAEPTAFYWAAADGVQGKYTDLGSWKMDFAGTVSATRLPCAADRIYGYGAKAGGKWIVANANMNGGAYELGGYSSGSQADSAWETRWLNVSNGTLTVRDTCRPSINFACSHDVRDGRLNLHFQSDGDAYLRTLGASGLPSRFLVGGGGQLNVYGQVAFIGLEATLGSGGQLLFDAGTYELHEGMTSGTAPRITNDGGTISFPNGWNCVGDRWSRAADFSKTFRIVQRDGELRLGGDVKKTATDGDRWRRGIYVHLGGGTLVAEAGKTVRFVQSFGTINGKPELFAAVTNAALDAAVTVETCAGAVLDMTPFTYAPGSAVTKTGPGLLQLSDARPPTLSVKAGAVEFLTAQSGLDGVSFADGATLSFGATDNAFAEIDNAAHVTFTLNPARIGKEGGTLLRSDNAALLETVRENFAIPEAFRETHIIEREGDSLTFHKIRRGLAIVIR